MQRRYRKSSISQSTRPTPKGEKDKEPAHNTFADYLFNIMYRRTNAHLYDDGDQQEEEEEEEAQNQFF